MAHLSPVPHPLDTAQLAEFHSRGFLIVRDLFTKMECEEVVAAAMDLAGPKSGSFKPVMQPHREKPFFLKPLANLNMVRVVEQIVGGEASGLQTEMFFCRPGTLGFTSHQDNFFVGAAPEHFVSAWIPLVDVTPEMGGLFVYPGSQRLGMLPVRETGLPATPDQDVDGYSREAVLPEDFAGAAEGLSVPAGSAVFLHGHLVHGSYSNHTAKFRHVLLCTYIRKGAAFSPGRHARRSEVALTSCA